MPDPVGPAEQTHLKTYRLAGPRSLERGGSLPHVDVAYETWGQLDPDAANAILVCHAISGDSHAARHHPADRPGWWDDLIGPGRPIDTDRFFVICTNVLGGCSGTTGPASANPATGQPWGPDFPAVTLGDMVSVQLDLLDALGIDALHAAVGGSLGGHQVMTLATTAPDRVRTAVVVASSPRLTAQAMGFDVVARNAIQSDPDFRGGRYLEHGVRPDNGLAIARMIGHITYLSVDAMKAKFDPDRHAPRDIATEFEKRFSVGSYLAHQGQKFTERFDANSYIAISSAMDWFDLGETPEQLRAAFARSTCDWLVVSFSSDWLFLPSQSREIVDALNAVGRRVTYTEVTSDNGHDAFLLSPDIAQYSPLVAARLDPPDPRAAAAAADLAANERRILDWIPSGSDVLDLGCGSGRLLATLRARDGGSGRHLGIEVAQPKLIAAAERGVDVLDYDLNRGLPAFGDGQFDVVVLSATLQIIEHVELLLSEMTRVGGSAVLSFTNFAYREFRDMFARDGRSPRSPAGRGNYNHAWYDTPNRRFPSILDMLDFCAARGYTLRRSLYLRTDAAGVTREIPATGDPNLNADTAILEIARGG